MRINIYSQELTNEVKLVTKKSDDGAVVFQAVQLILHSSPMLHHPPADDDRSAVTFWLPKSSSRREEMARAFERAAEIFRTAPIETPAAEDAESVATKAFLDVAIEWRQHINLIPNNTPSKEMLDKLDALVILRGRT